MNEDTSGQGSFLGDMGTCVVGRNVEKSVDIANTSNKQIMFSVIGEGDNRAF